MAHIGIRNLDTILKFESIRGKKISEEDFEYLKATATHKHVFFIEFCSPAEFTKPMCLFVNNTHKFSFVREGNPLSYSEINLPSLKGNRYFLAYKINGNKMYIYGYFPGELD